MKKRKLSEFLPFQKDKVNSIYHNADSNKSSSNREHETTKRKTKMKSKYCLIRSIERIEPNEPVFCLWAGKSRRDQIRLSLVENFCNDMGWFLRQWDEDTNFQLIQASAVDLSHSKVPMLHLNRVDMEICDFYSRLIDGNLQLIAKSARQQHGVARLLTMLDLNFMRKHTGEARSHQCQSVTRKNLKSGSLTEKISTAISFCLILVLLVLDWVVTLLMGVLFY